MVETGLSLSETQFGEQVKSNRSARAKGVYERLVISRHALRNALLPAITAPGGKSQRLCPDRYREPFSPISRLLDGGLRHTYAGREQSRGKGIGRGANSAVARPRRSWPTLGGAVWSLASDAKQRCPDIDARLVCRRGVGASCRDHEEVRPWRSNELHSAPSRLTERPMNTT